jgi:chromosome partitioning protein
MQIITISNQKGGVGKTTTAHALLTGLANMGYKVLALDADPQTNLTYTTGINMDDTPDLYNLLKKQASFLEVVQQVKPGFDIIPGSLNLAGADMEFTAAGREYMIREALEPVKEKYDFCIIDTPPTLGILTVNALTASHKIIVPMAADVYSLQGLSQLQGMVENVKKYCNPGLTIDGLLLTKYSDRAIINRNLKDSLQQTAAQLHTRLYKTTIREAVAVKEIQFLQSDIFTEYPKAKVTEDYKQFIKEFLGE